MRLSDSPSHFLASRFAAFAGAVLLCAACGAFRPEPARYAGDDVRAFVQKHRDDLQAEIAAGSGPRLYDLAIIANCQDVPELGRRLHRRQDEIFAPAGTPDTEVADRMVRFLTQRRELRCLSLDVSRSGDLAGGRRQIGPRRSEVTRRGGTW
jgi:Protein of unknown function (DUF3015)